MLLQRYHGWLLQVFLLIILLVTAGADAILQFHGFSFPPHVLRLTSILLLFFLLLAVGWGRKRILSVILLGMGSGIWVGLPLLYSTNASYEWREGVGLFPVSHIDWLPASTFRSGSMVAIWMALAVVGVVGTVVHLSARYRTYLLIAINGLAFGIALWVLNQRLEPRAFPVYPWTGWFVNPNHYAAFACLMFPVAVAMGLQVHRNAKSRGRLSSPAPLFYILAGILCWSVWVVQSRAGIGILFLQWIGILVGFAYEQMRLTEGRSIWCVFRLRSPFDRLPFHVPVVGAILSLVVACAFVVKQAVERNVVGDLAFRWLVVRDVLRMLRTRLWWGMGPGSFAAVFPYYQSDEIGQHYFHHAHNDPVQFLAEWGLLGALALGAGLCLLLLSGAVRKRLTTTDIGCVASSGWLRWGVILALAGVFFHSLVDFPFQHPFILLLSFLLFAMLRKPVDTEDETLLRDAF